MHAVATELEQIIRQEIDLCGAISFARFMELALYHPAHGYYERNHKQTGRDGDFFTSVSIGSLYGEILGFDFSQRFAQLKGANLALVEAGAHDGQLASDILNYLREYQQETFRRIEYVIIEPSLKRAQKQFDTLAAYSGKVRWVKAWEEIPEFRGICFSNELLDAMPVHVFRWEAPAGQWTEWGIASLGEDFNWKPLPPQQQSERARKLLARIPAELMAVLPDGFTVELSPDAISWWLQAAHRLSEGWVATADYGFQQEDFFSPHRAQGTLRAYSRHRTNAELLKSVGEQDITAHVNFSLLMKAGASAGLETKGFLSQERFIKDVIQRVEALPAQFPLWTPMRYRQLMTLMHPEHLGRLFKVLVQSRI